MRGRDNFHSRLVAWMKIILPVVALGLLSTLFLLSRKVDLTDAVPVAQIDLEQRAHDQGATNPAFSGVSSGGEQVTFRADSARPDPEDAQRILAREVRAQLRLNGGTLIDIAAQHGATDQRDLSTVLHGDVHITTSTGYDIRTDRLEAEFDTLAARSPGKISGTGPIGALTAGRMELRTDAEDDAAHLLFTDGVKLIYTPAGKED